MKVTKALPDYERVWTSVYSVEEMVAVVRRRTENAAAVRAHREATAPRSRVTVLTEAGEAAADKTKAHQP